MSPISICVAGPRGRLAALQLRRAVFIIELGRSSSEVFDEQDAESLLILASLSDTPVASARLLIEMGEDDLERAEVQWLAVLPSHRGQGIGAALLSAVESEALRRGLDSIQTTAPEGLRSVLERVGYERDGAGLVRRLW